MTGFSYSLEASGPRYPSGPYPYREGLIIFTRYPEPGKTKTRLIPSLGPDGAAGLQRSMTEHTLTLARQLQSYRPVSIEVHYEGGSKHLMEQWLGRDPPSRPQGSGDLGERMVRAFHEAFQRGMDRVFLVGTDIPGITARILLQAFESLSSTDMVLGPCRDGGYYLIGLRQTFPQLFVDIPWGTEKVLARTSQIADDLGLSTVLLETLEDLDRPEDLHLWGKTSKHMPKPHPIPRISIIIPTLNEAPNLASTLRSIRNASNVEVIVVDGGSSDETVKVARSWGTKVLILAPGRARQMNAGAAQATGEVLLFLHADTHLPRGYDNYIRKILARPHAVAGAFQLRIDGRLPGLRIAEKMVNLRSRHLQFPYGDQAIFLRTDLFREMGGFPDMPILEDFELIRRLRRRGRIVIASVPILTSARRWENLGIVRTTLINYAIPLAYSLGTSPPRLARWYGRKRGIQTGQRRLKKRRNEERIP
ncbi:MAG: TIGR04283 family arsenosugar biosynthesis glycosyltransferase [Thermodesulfobacteriota bacterium]